MMAFKKNNVLKSFERSWSFMNYLLIDRLNKQTFGQIKTIDFYWKNDFTEPAFFEKTNE